MTTKAKPATERFAEPAYDDWQPESHDTRDEKGPLLGFIEVEKVIRDGVELRGSKNGGTIGEMVDEYFCSLVKEGSEIREFKLVFGEQHQFEQAILPNIDQVFREDSSKVHPRFRDLAVDGPRRFHFNRA